MASTLNGTGVTFSNGTTQSTGTSGTFTFNSGYGSDATVYGCRAWMNFNGTGTAAIRSSGGMSSLTDNGTGDYTVNLSFTMPDSNYVIQWVCSSDSNGSASGTGGFNAAVNTNMTTPALVAPSTTQFRVGTSWTASGRPDPTYCMLAIFR